MPGFTALLDACVLYPAPLRDLLIETANTGIYRARWSDDIHDEWMRNVLANNDQVKPEALERTRTLMDLTIPNACVTGYEELAKTLSLPDDGDTHVLAAAIVGRADVIVTSNLKDFPAEILEPYGIEAQHPDEFLMHQCDLKPEAFYACARRIRARLQNPTKTGDEYLDALRRCQLALVADELRKVKSLI